MGRGAVNQKGPEAAFIAALHAIRGAGKKMPVNLVLVAEGEEEIGSPHFRQVVNEPEVAAALKQTVGVVMPGAESGSRRQGERAARREGRHRGRARVERREVGSRSREGRPLVEPRAARQPRVPSRPGARDARDADGDPAIEGFGREARAPTPEQKKLLDVASQRLSESTAKSLLAAKRWAHDKSWRDSLEQFLFTPTVNIEGSSRGTPGRAARRSSRTGRGEARPAARAGHDVRPRSRAARRRICRSAASATSR